jgi:hypothetical protein
MQVQAVVQARKAAPVQAAPVQAAPVQAVMQAVMPKLAPEPKVAPVALAIPEEIRVSASAVVPLAQAVRQARAEWLAQAVALELLVLQRAA